MIPLATKDTIRDEWDRLVDDLGEVEARKMVAQRLRDFAEQVERGYPYVFGCRLPSKDTLPFVEIMVCCSYPWGG